MSPGRLGSAESVLAILAEKDSVEHRVTIHISHVAASVRDTVAAPSGLAGSYLIGLASHSVHQ